jgi:hypothetical protein
MKPPQLRLPIAISTCLIIRIRIQFAKVFMGVPKANHQETSYFLENRLSQHQIVHCMERYGTSKQFWYK